MYIVSFDHCRCMMARTYVGGPSSHSVSYFQQHELGASNNEATTINGHNNNNNNKGHFPKRKPGPPKNIVQRLIHREIHFVNSNVSPFIANHKLHQNLLPNFSVENIEKPNCFLRKFTYDGRYMLAFSSDQTCVELYEYQGPAAAAHLLQGISSIHHDTLEAADPIPNNPEAESIKKNIFSMFFRLKHTVPVTSNGEQLNRECSLFTENHRYAIVVSVTFANDETAVFYDLYQNNESLPIGGRSLLEDYTLHVIDMERGLVVDRRSYKTDKIYLSYNHGIYLYKNTLAVLSMQHQTIHIYHIHPDGSLIDVRKIGRFCFEDDAALINYRPSFLGAARPANRNNTVHPFREVPFNTLKHRLLVFLFKYSQVQSSIKGNNLPTKQFFNDFNIFTNLRIWKMQLLDEEHILLKYEQEESLMNRENLFRNWNLFVVYNLRTSEIVNVYPQSSEEFLYIYENFVDYFRHPPYYICSLSNNVFAKKNHDKLMKTCADAKGGSYKDAIKMILAFLPLNAQSYSPR